MTTARRPPRRQHGAAILIAMLILTLVATLSAGMVWLQWRGIEVESAERARSQGEWLLNGALDWARLILKSDARAGNTVDHLGEPWAMPLAESRLSTFLSADDNHSEDSGPDAFLSGQISDANARYNLFRLYGVQSGRLELQNFQNLCAAIGIQSGVADAIYAGLGQSWSTTQNLDDDVTQKDTSNSVLMPTEVSQLAWYGVDPAAIKQLEPFVTIIPTDTKVNVNTASAEVLMAAIPGINRGGAQAIIQQRAQKPFTDAQSALTAANYQAPPPVNGQTAPPPAIDVKSDYFEVYGQLRYEQHVLRERTLVHRLGMQQVDVLRRERLPPDVQ
jgi:general secretion pathway protein K